MRTTTALLTVALFLARGEASRCSYTGASLGPSAAWPALSSPLAAESVRSRVIVCGIDRTGSYRFTRAGLELCGRVLASANAGDEFIARWISGASYSNNEFVARVRLPGPIPDCPNPFDDLCRRRRASAIARLSTVKRAELTRLLGLRPPLATRTDIYGFVQSAADIFASAPRDAERWLYIATDMEDNRRFRLSADLSAVQVVILAFQTSADPRYTLRLRDRWIAYLGQCGAISVTVQPAEVVR